MKSTPTLRSANQNKTRSLLLPVLTRRLFLLTLVSFVAVAALLGIAASANKANRAAKARAAQAANAAAQAINTKSAINPVVQNDKQPLAPQSATITATLTDNVSDITTVAPGGMINYTAVIKNIGVPGADDAGAVNYTHTIGANTTLVPLSVHASPIAINNTYTTAIGNTLLEVSNSPSSTAPKVTAAGTLFDNDTIATAPDFIQLHSFQNPSASGGTVSVNPNGSFTYLPPVGFTGIDTFSYIIRNSSDNTLQDTATVTITVNSPRVWYVDNSGPNGDGRSTSPFNTLPNAAAVDAAGDIIYIFTGGGNYTGGITLLNNEQVIGNGVALVVNTFTLRAAGSRPTVVNAGGNGMTLGLNNTLTGFNFGACTGFAIQGASVGTLAVNNMLINNTSGGAMDLTGVTTPTVNVVMDSTTSTGGTSNVRLVGLNGTVTLGSGALSGSTAGAANHAFSNSGGNAGITFSGSITKANQGNVVNIASRTGGTVTLSGTINGSSSNGINVSSNTGGTIDFTNGTKTLNTGANAAVTLGTNTGTTINFTNGGLDIDTTSGAGFTATGGGTVTVTTGANPNTILSTTGTGLNVANTTIGANGLTFQSINVDGTDAAPTNGIILNTTGSSGGLTVTGTGSAGTGGTIQDTSGDGILVTTTEKLSLSFMNITSNLGDGIGGSGINGLQLATCSITNNGDSAATDESGINIAQLTGTASGGARPTSITNCTVQNNFEFQIQITNSSGTLTNLTMSGNIISTTAASGISANLFNFLGNTTAVMTLNLTSGSFTGNWTPASPIPGPATISGTGLFAGTQGTTHTVNVSGATFTNNNAGVDCSTTNSATTFSCNVSGNDFQGTRAIAINSFHNGNAPFNRTFNGTFSNNTIGTIGTANSGSFNGRGIDVSNEGAITTANYTITNNQIREVGVLGTAGAEGIGVNVGLGGQATGGGATNVTITGNTIRDIRNSRALIVSDNQDPAFAPFPSVCANISGNTITGTIAGQAGNGQFMRVREGSGTVRVTQAAVTTAANVAELDDANGFNDNPAGSRFSQGGSPLYSQPACTPSSAMHNFAGSQREYLAQTVRDEALDNSTSTLAMAQPNTESAKPSVIAAPIAKVSSKDGVASVAAKATPKASTAESARVNRSEGRLSHHAVQKGRPAAGSPNAPLADVSVALGTLPAAAGPQGKTVTIKYSVTVNSPPLVREVTAQGSVSFTNGPSPVATTDPGPPADPLTKTKIDTTITWTGANSIDWNTAGNWNVPGPVVSTYAPGATNPAVNDVIIPAGVLPNEPTIGVANPDITIFSLNLAAGRTLTIDPLRVLTIGAPAPGVGGDLTLNGLITGGELRFGTGSHVMTVGGGSLSSTNLARVLSGSSVVLSNTLQAGALAINAGGTMDISGGGGRTLSLNSAGGLADPGGGLATTGSTIIFNGAVAQSAAGIGYHNLTINNTAAGAPNALGATLTGNASVAGTLALTSNDLNTSTFTLSQPNTTASTGVSDVVGTITRTAAFGTTTITFGNPNNQITFGAAGTKPTALTVNLVKAAPVAPQPYPVAVQRTYTISKTGGTGFTSTLRLHYLDSELNGNLPEANLNLRWFRANPPPIPPPGAGFWPAAPTSGLNATDNWVECNPVTETDGLPNNNQFLASRWTFATLVPTAPPGVVTGRIVDANGQPVEGAVVRMEGTQNRKFITDANGVYRFDDVETGGFYVVTPSRVNYTFNPSARAFSQLGQTTEALFGATATGQTANPLDTPEYFVRQHYVDFLGREPDEAGFNFWSDQIIECGFDQHCIERRRENVSAAYFLSMEFQGTGGLVDGMYRASYGVRPQFGEFMPDARTVGLGVRVGDDGWEAKLQANKEAFAAAFVNRPAFHAMYDGMDASTFVDTLISHTGVSFTAAERDAWISMSRADALRSIAENGRFVNAKFNDTFVMMQYFGYLRRDADANGFAFWLNKLNEFNGNFEQAEMVRAFIISGEFRDRFPR